MSERGGPGFGGVLSDRGQSEGAPFGRAGFGRAPLGRFASRGAAFGLAARGCLAGAILGFCLLGPLVWTADPAAIDVSAVLQAPTGGHPGGTDGLGRDELARLMQGGAATLLVAGPACVAACVVGAAYGLAAGLAPRWMDAVLMRLLDAVLALPSLVLLIALASLLVLDTGALVLLVSATAWAPLARLVRNEVRALRPRDFMLAAEQMGAGRGYLAWAHVLPNLRPLLLVNLTLLLGDCIALVSALGFLGLGVQPPRTSWGQLLAEGLGLIDLGAWWLIAPPGLLIAVSLLAIAALAGGRRGA